MEFTALNNFFDHIYVITLERETERQQNISPSLEGLNYSFFYGIDKKHLVMDELISQGVYDEAKAIAMHRFDKPMNTGQIGCSWSHRMVYEDVIKNNYKKVLILEDDVVPCKDGFELLEQTLKNLPSGWELLYLDCDKNLCINFGTRVKQVGYHIRRLLRRIKWSHSVIKNLYSRKHSDNLMVAGMHDYSNAYAITLTAAKKLTDLQTPVCFLSDGLLAHACTNKLINGYVSVSKSFQYDAKLKAKSLIG